MQIVTTLTTAGTETDAADPNPITYHLPDADAVEALLEATPGATAVEVAFGAFTVRYERGF